MSQQIASDELKQRQADEACSLRPGAVSVRAEAARRRRRKPRGCLSTARPFAAP